MHTLLLAGLTVFSIGCKKDDVDANHDDGHEHQHGDTDLPDDFDPTTTVETESGLTISYTTDPSPIPDSTEFSITFSLSAGTLIEGDATMPSHGGHGMTVLPIVTHHEDGTFTAAPFEFHMPGYWVIHATVEDDSGNEERIDFDVDCCE